MSDETCKTRWRPYKNSRVSDIRKLLKSYYDGEEEHEELGNVFDYGLEFTYIRGNRDHYGYWCFLISWGGPSEEFRFYADREYRVYKIEFAFMDWFDCHSRKLYGNDHKVLEEFWELLVDIESARIAYEKEMDY